MEMKYILLRTLLNISGGGGGGGFFFAARTS
jgi:hypothetical protein